IEERYPVGTEIEGKIRNLTSFGAFVEIEEGIDGLVHISDMSWTRRINHPSELLKKGDVLKVVVLNIDVENNRISLGLKQTQENPWNSMEERYPVGKDAKGEVVQLLDRGVVVRLDDYIEGFVPQSQLGWEDLEDPSEVIRVEDELPLRVIELEPSSRRIVLSVRSYFNGRPMEELSAFRESLEGREKLEPVVVETVDSTEETDSEESEDAVDETAVEASEDKNAVEDTVPAPEEESAEPSEVIAEEEAEEAQEEVKEAPEKAEEAPEEVEEAPEEVKEAPEEVKEAPEKAEEAPEEVEEAPEADEEDGKK
ncbi:MAG: S1 RNA-binding domain-containing protein, partial [Candidatus Aegiribacteria sp.]|nr:S1 RNA-binding domain-containing protein [Candidatus Aegiribacteria sp.]